jgi:uncharacterized membrane protein YebE (DUF533 family)
MFNATRLLGSMLESVRAPSAPQRMNSALQSGAAAPANPLQAILASLGGGAQGAAGGAQAALGNLTGSFGDLARKALGNPTQEVRSNNPVAVGGLGALAGALLGGGRGAVGGGLLAALGSIAYAAMQNSGQAAQAAAPATEAEVQDSAMVLVRAMIEAAKADGQVDAAESQRILGRLDAAEADAEAREWVRQQLAAPSDLAGLARQVRTPEQAAQVYAAALLAIEVDTDAERDFLARLAQALNLPEQAASQLRAALGVRI